MAVNVSLDWSVSLEGTDDKGRTFTFPEDKLDRQKYAKFIVKFLADQGYNSTEGTPHNYVLNLNSEWGSGKTYFLKRLSVDLKDYYPTVYIDAWAQDYSEDPLMTVISSMIKQLRVQAGKSEDDPLFKAPRKLVGLLKAVAPAVARGLSKRYLGIDPAMIMDAADETGLESDEVDDKGKPIDMGIAASKLVSHLIKEHDAKANAIDSIKINVKEWVEAVISADNTDHTKTEKRTYPAFIFIDELDRCRPSYAVEMLETIKHIFDIPGVVFVVGTDTEQLQHAVKAIYGEGFDARNYLGRFFNSRFTLRQPNFNNLLEVHCDHHKLSGEHFRDLGVLVWPENDASKDNIANITAILNCFNLSARPAIQITDRIIATLCNLPRGRRVDLLMLTTLFCIREKDEKTYAEIVAGNFKRARKGYGNDINLSMYMSLEYANDRQIIMNFDPVQKVSNFFINCPNLYEEGVYAADLECYFEMFSSFFDSGENEPIGVLISTSSQATNRSPKNEIGVELNNLQHTRKNAGHKKTISKYWMKYLYLLDELGELKLKDYKDLVELSSSLDWLD
ncbi:KAP family NTPase [Shewanella benthica]|uniref:KAP family P-loop NTPase fold protein n=1 Tax=Shewanella benthica TaxID=43661 RepID=UPI00187AEA46|nr:P-loop NTPase fold protein [Shewanella benthica]MBE7214908.1 NTPase KAP [Shewanella benthica]MCL1061950.1 KAP family NTPase [Shewanella benthica]